MHRGLPQSEFCSLAAALFAYRKHSFAEQKNFYKIFVLRATFGKKLRLYR